MAKRKSAGEHSSKLDPSPDVSTLAPEEEDTEKTQPTEKTKKKQAKEKTRAKDSGKKEEQPQKAESKAPVSDEDAKNCVFVGNGKYKIGSRPGSSAYAILYRIMDDMTDFAQSEVLLENLDLQDEEACKRVLRRLMVSRDILEQTIRADHVFIQYCDAKTKRYKKQAAEGSVRAQKVLSNPNRSKNGKWVANLKEVFSVCNGSSSSEAINRNIQKLKEAGLVFRQFPRMPRRGHRVYLTMIPERLLNKLNKVLKNIFGDENGKNFASYLETNFRDLFGE